jgi:hypothetical protein
MVERQNRTLGDSLRTLLLGAEQVDWDLLLPHLMRAFRATPHSVTGETANYLMLGREVRLPGQLLYEAPLSESTPVEQYARDLQERLKIAHNLLREKQQSVRVFDQDDGLIFMVGDSVYLTSHRRKRGQAKKLSPKFVGPYRITASYPNHTYQIERNGQMSIQHESQLKLHHNATCKVGRAPVLLEPARRPNMRGNKQRHNVADDDDEWWAVSLPTLDTPNAEATSPAELHQLE